MEQYYTDINRQIRDGHGSAKTMGLIAGTKNWPIITESYSTHFEYCQTKTSRGQLLRATDDRQNLLFLSSITTSTKTQIY